MYCLLNKLSDDDDDDWWIELQKLDIIIEVFDLTYSKTEESAVAGVFQTQTQDSFVQL